jgi:hypothetical protein
VSRLRWSAAGAVGESVAVVGGGMRLASRLRRVVGWLWGLTIKSFWVYAQRVLTLFGDCRAGLGD